MPNITSVTNPVPGQEGVSRPVTVTPNDPRIQNVPDPSRVVRPDGRTEQQDASNANITTRHFGSNFQAFLKGLQANGTITQSIAHMLFTMSSATVVSSGVTDGISTQFAELLSLLQVTPEELPELLKTLKDGSVRFTGPLSDYLRGMLAVRQDPHTQTDVAQFLKAYNDFAASGHIERGMMRDIQQMVWFMPERYGQAVRGQLEQLQEYISSGDRTGALRLLQNTLLPYMSDYVSKMHDFGIARNLLSLLMLDIARYENGSLSNVLLSFRQLAAYDREDSPFAKMSDEELVAMFRASAAESAEKEHPITRQIAELASHTMRGEGSVELRQTLQSVVDSVLINQSVYMPLCHMMIPIELEDRKIFSEIWVDPDSESSGTVDANQRVIRLLLKFDIEDMGFFDMVLTCRNHTVDIDLRCPRWLGSFSEDIRSAISSLAEADGVRVGSAKVGAIQRPLNISEVFPKIFERKDSLDVTI